MRKPSNNTLPEPPWLSKLQTAFTNYATDYKGGLFCFNTCQRTWKKILEENYALNTLIITPDNQKAYITCVHGFWILDLTKEKLAIYSYFGN